MNGNFVITGAAQGFGKEFSARVLNAGGRVLLADRNQDGVLTTTKEFQEQHGQDRCDSVIIDVTDKQQWEALWERARQMFGEKNDQMVLVNNAGVSPVLGFDANIKINFEGVLLGCRTFQERYGKDSGGPGGLVINIASLAGVTQGFSEQHHQYQVAKHGCVAITRSFGSAQVSKKTGIAHVGIAPWFADTGILDGLDKEKLKKKIVLDFVTVGRVGEALELAVRDRRSGGLVAVMPGCPLTYWPDPTATPAVAVVYLTSRLAGLLGFNTLSTTQMLSMLTFLAIICIYVIHLVLTAIGI